MSVKKKRRERELQKLLIPLVQAIHLTATVKENIGNF